MIGRTKFRIQKHNEYALSAIEQMPSLDFEKGEEKLFARFRDKEEITAITNEMEEVNDDISNALLNGYPSFVS